jgi:hypothetical protein
MGAQLDDPNREAVGVAPIWTPEGTAPPEVDPPPEGEGAAKARAPRHAAPAPAPAPSEDPAPGVT